MQGAWLLRRLLFAIIALSSYCILLTSCGGGYNNSNAPVTSNLTKRVFASNQFTGALDIVNASTDKLDIHRVITDSSPTKMVMSPDKLTTLVAVNGGTTLDVVRNTGEFNAGSLALPGATESFFFLPDNKTAYVAIRNTGTVYIFDTTNTGAPKTVTVPNVRWIVRSNNGHTVLAFPDDNSNNVYSIDTTATTPAATVSTVTFDRPVWAVFSSDDSKAYVMNCGPECGGGTASVQTVNIPALTAAGPAAGVPGATHGLLNGNTLYVAGTPPATACVANVNEVNGCGSLSKLDVSAGLGAPTSFEISNGYHDTMVLGPNSKLYIGAELTCTVTLPNGNGCLSVFNTTANTVKIVGPCDSSCGGLNDVTGMTAVTGRNVMYVVEGGELHIYDTTTDALQSTQVDTVGRTVDVVSPD